MHPMTLPRILLALAIIAPSAAAADLTTLDGKKLVGDIVGISGTDLTFKSPAGEEKFLVTTIQSIVLGPVPKGLETGKNYTSVELTDGSLFRCSDIAIKGETVELKLLSPGATGPAAMNPRTITVPMRPALYAVNRNAGDLKLEQDFRNLLRTRGRFDLFVFKRTGTNDQGKEIEYLDVSAGTFGAGDSAAGTIAFKSENPSRDPKDKDAKEDDSSQKRISRLAGMIFSQKLEAVLPAICKVIDSDGNELVAAAVARTPKGYSISTVAGVKIDLDANQVSKFDFAAGSLKYLSDLDPVGLEESGTDPEHYQRDKNLDKRPIQLFTEPGAGKVETFPKGLTLKAKTMIMYELKGHYKTFRAVVGVDADKENEAGSQVKITVDDAGAGQNLFKGTVKKGDKPLDLNLSVTNVDRLKITVESDGTVTDLGNQVSLGNARVLK
jgi:NPCBM/NEW2 domain